MLIKIVLFGYSRGLVTSRALERACQENITFMALSCAQKPGHSTIAAFVSSIDKEIEPLFTKALLICEELCPTGAMEADSGKVDKEKCIACLACVANYPENVSKINDMSDSWSFKLEMEKTTEESLKGLKSKIYL